MNVGDVVRVKENYPEEFLRGKLGALVARGYKYWRVMMNGSNNQFLFKTEELELLNPCNEVVDRIEYAALKQRLDLMEISKKHYQAESIKLYDEVQNLKKTNEELSHSVEIWMQNYLNLKKGVLKVLNG